MTNVFSRQWHGRAAAVTLIVVAAAGAAGCRSEAEQSPTLTADPALIQRLITTASFPGQGIDVRDITAQTIENAGANKQTGTTSPPECDGSEITKAAGGAVASVAASGAKPQTTVILNRAGGATDPVAAVDDWINRCASFTVQSDDGTSSAKVQRLTPPAAAANQQVGFRVTIKVDSMDGQPMSGISGELTTVEYLTRIDDVVVMAMSLGGEGWGGSDLDPDLKTLDAAFVAQVAKITGG